MKFTRNVAVIVATLAFGAAPAIAIAGGKGSSQNAPGHTKSTTTMTTTSSTTSGASTAAYGRICAAESESTKHVTGMKGTPFSTCVVALAQADKSSKASASSACKTESKKRVKGSTTKGTPFSECVSAVAKLRSSTKS
jgi:hypothetical protein